MASFHVIYHSPCPDGCFAALAASLWFERAGIDPLGDRVKWCPMEVFKPAEKQFAVESVDAEDEVFLLDYTGGADFVLKLASKCSRCTVLDHHESAVKALRTALAGIEAPPNLKLVLDMHRSGATIALDYFSSRPVPAEVPVESGEPVAKKGRLTNNSEWTSDYSNIFRDEDEAKRLLRIFRFIEDADIWHWWLEGSKHFSAGFHTLNLDMNPNKNPKLFDALRSLRVDAVMEIGAAAQKATDDAIAEELNRTFELEIGPASGIRCLGVITERGDLRSALGHQIALKSKELGLRGFGCVIYHVPGLPDGQIKLSVRAINDENSLEITECFGGGGHKGASSCNVDISAVESWRTSPSSEVPAVPEKSPTLKDANDEDANRKDEDAKRKCETHGLKLVPAFGCPCCKPDEP